MSTEKATRERSFWDEDLNAALYCAVMYCVERFT